jgi:hypothetical protein
VPSKFSTKSTWHYSINLSIFTLQRNWIHERKWFLELWESISPSKKTRVSDNLTSFSLMSMRAFTNRILFDIC